MLERLKKHPVITFGVGFLVVASAHLMWMSWRTPPPQERYIELKARKFAYTPSILDVNRGDRLHIRMVSEDVHHGFYLDGYELEMTAQPSLAGGVHFVADRTGKFSFRCSMTCGPFHPYMIGYLRVRPDYRLAGASWLTGGIFGVFMIYLFDRQRRNGPPRRAGESEPTPEKKNEEGAP